MCRRYSKQNTNGKMQQKQQKRCGELYGTKIYPTKLRKIYFTGKFSCMEVKCKQWLKKKLWNKITERWMWLRYIQVAKEDSGEMKHYGRNGRYFISHKNRKEATENDELWKSRNGRGIIIQNVLQWLPQETTKRQQPKKLPRLWYFDRSAQSELNTVELLNWT